MYSAGYSWPLFMNLEFSWQIFENSSNTKFYENPFNGAELFHADGQAEIQDEANSCFSQFCEWAS